MNGGKIMGTFPKLSSDSDHWLSRGRLIPTTPWESVWNGLAQWLHVHHDEDLVFALPNRASFGTCSLFTDTDLFVDGHCQCMVENGQEYTLCDDVTYPPTMMPIRETPTTSPSVSPTVSLPEHGTLVNTVLTPGSTVRDFGCNSGSRPWRIVDSMSTHYDCDRTGMNNVADPSYQLPGMTILPDHGLLSIPKGLRIYTGASCGKCDPVTYILEGRTDPMRRRLQNTTEWVEIGSGQLPWYSDAIGRNPGGLAIDSSYEDGDSALQFTSISYPTQSASYIEYRLSFPETRNPLSNTLRFGDVEIPGMLLPPEPSANPSLAPTTAAPTGALPNGTLVNTILTPDSTVTDFGCNSGSRPWRIVDGTTVQYGTYDCLLSILSHSNYVHYLSHLR